MASTERLARRSGFLGSRAQPVELRCKRLFDLTCAAAACVLLAPVMLFIALLIRVNDGGPVLFRQKRVGFRGRPFICLKFRTMVTNAEDVLQDHLARNPKARHEWERQQKLTEDPRVTPLGRVLRKTSLDELPQFYNVLVGDMSIVGPRPIVPSEMGRYGEGLRFYLSVRPGITGLWQVSGRNDCSYEEQIALDCRYVAEWRFWKDILIILRTVPVVLLQRGSY